MGDELSGSACCVLSSRSSSTFCSSTLDSTTGVAALGRPLPGASAGLSPTSSCAARGAGGGGDDRSRERRLVAEMMLESGPRCRAGGGC